MYNLQLLLKYIININFRSNIPIVIIKLNIRFVNKTMEMFFNLTKIDKTKYTNAKCEKSSLRTIVYIYTPHKIIKNHKKNIA